MGADVALWGTTAGAMYAMAERNGYIKTIQHAGGIVVRETCPFLARSRVIAPNKGYKTLTTNSAKMAFYAPRPVRSSHATTAIWAE